TDTAYSGWWTRDRDGANVIGSPTSQACYLWPSLRNNLVTPDSAPAAVAWPSGVVNEGAGDVNVFWRTANNNLEEAIGSRQANNALTWTYRAVPMGSYAGTVASSATVTINPVRHTQEIRYKDPNGNVRNITWHNDSQTWSYATLTPPTS